MVTFMANTDTPPATMKVHIYSWMEQWTPYTSAPISITAMIPHQHTPRVSPPLSRRVVSCLTILLLKSATNKEMVPGIILEDFASTCDVAQCQPNMSASGPWYYIFLFQLVFLRSLVLSGYQQVISMRANPEGLTIQTWAGQLMYFRASMPHAGPMALEMLQAQQTMIGASVPSSPGHIFNTATPQVLHMRDLIENKTSIHSKLQRLAKGEISTVLYIGGAERVYSLMKDQTKHTEH